MMEGSGKSRNIANTKIPLLVLAKPMQEESYE